MKMIQYFKILLLGLGALLYTSCENFEDLDVPNYNDPNRDQVFRNSQDFPNLLSGAYSAWWNHVIGASPQFALLPASETMGSGYGSWGSNPFYAKPRESVPNGDGDPVLIPQASWWYGLYQAVPTVNDVVNRIINEDLRVVIDGQDFTSSTLAHGYLLQGILFGHLAMLYDKAFLLDENTDVNTYEFSYTEYTALREYALSRIDQAIAVCDTASFTDPIAMMPGVTFTNESLSRFAHSMGARTLAYSARTAEENQQSDWMKIMNYARNGITEDFLVEIQDGWQGLVITRDAFGYHQLVLNWGWVRVHQRLIHMMAPDDPDAAYPWPFGVAALDTVTSPDLRFDEYFEYNATIPWAGSASSKGYHIMTHYSLKRFRDLYDQGVGFVNFYTKAENDYYIAEANLQLNQNVAEAVDILNATRVDKGGLMPASVAEPVAALKEKLYYERFIETLMTFPLGSYFDRRRTDVPGFQLFEGTVRQLPVPLQELNLHGTTNYTFGGVGNEM